MFFCVVSAKMSRRRLLSNPNPSGPTEAFDTTNFPCCRNQLLHRVSQTLNTKYPPTSWKWSCLPFTELVPFCKQNLPAIIVLTGATIREGHFKGFQLRLRPDLHIDFFSSEDRVIYNVSGIFSVMKFAMRISSTTRNIV